jgi:molybdate transport system regulatory protein
MEIINEVKPLALRSKAWLEIEGHPVIGEGRLTMLQAIHQYGSILRASQETGISYRRMRGAIRDMEKAIGKPLVRAYRGGGDRGGAELTPAAHALLDSFEKVTHALREIADAKFVEVFR